MPQAATYGFSYGVSNCFCYPVGAYMQSASTCIGCKAYTMCDIRPVVINPSAIYMLDYVFPKTLTGSGGTSNVVLDLNLYS